MALVYDQLGNIIGDDGTPDIPTQPSVDAMKYELQQKSTRPQMSIAEAGSNFLGNASNVLKDYEKKLGLTNLKNIVGQIPVVKAVQPLAEVPISMATSPFAAAAYGYVPPGSPRSAYDEAQAKAAAIQYQSTNPYTNQMLEDLSEATKGLPPYIGSVGAFAPRSTDARVLRAQALATGKEIADIPADFINAQQRLKAMTAEGKPTYGVSIQQMADEFGDFLERQKSRGKPSVSILGANDLMPDMNAYIVKGKSSSTWNANAAKQAEELAAKGVPDNIIHQGLGVWKGPDNQWRQEISNYDASVKADKLKSIMTGFESAMDAGDFAITNITNVINHPEFFDAYPEAKNLDVAFGDIEGRASYSHADRRVYINREYMLDPVETMRLLVHELTHHVQNVEGFDRGGNEREFPDHKVVDTAQHLETMMVNENITLPEAVAKYTSIVGKAPSDDAIAYAERGQGNATPYMYSRDRYDRIFGEAEARSMADRIDIKPEDLQKYYPLDKSKTGLDVNLKDTMLRIPGSSNFISSGQFKNQGYAFNPTVAQMKHALKNKPRGSSKAEGDDKVDLTKRRLLGLSAAPKIDQLPAVVQPVQNQPSIDTVVSAIKNIPVNRRDMLKMPVNAAVSQAGQQLVGDVLAKNVLTHTPTMSKDAAYSAVGDYVKDILRGASFGEDFEDLLSPEAINYAYKHLSPRTISEWSGVPLKDLEHFGITPSTAKAAYEVFARQQMEKPYWGDNDSGEIDDKTYKQWQDLSVPYVEKAVKELGPEATDKQIARHALDGYLDALSDLELSKIKYPEDNAGQLSRSTIKSFYLNDSDLMDEAETVLYDMAKKYREQPTNDVRIISQGPSDDASMAIKERGGNWPDSRLDTMLRQRLLDTLPSSLADPINRFELASNWEEKADDIGYSPEQKQRLITSNALNQWLSRRLKNYIKNDLGTPKDPVRDLADQGITHINDLGEFANDLESNLVVDSVIGKARKAQGQPAEGFATTALGRDWESRSDFSISPQKLRDWIDMNPSGAARNIGIEKALEKDPNAKMNTLDSSSIEEDLGFGHLTDELHNAIRADSDLPQHLQLSIKDLERMTVPEAVRLVAKINKYRKDLAEKATVKNVAEFRQNFPAILQFEDGSSWHQLQLPEYKEGELPKGFTVREHHTKKGFYIRDEKEEHDTGAVGKTPEEAIESFNTPYYYLDNALKEEGELMGHCVGGYTDEVADGSSSIFTLRDSKGKPHVTIESAPRMRFNSNVERTRTPDGAYDIVQIKGKGNREVVAKYRQQVIDFLNDLPTDLLKDVIELRNIDAVDTLAMYDPDMTYGAEIINAVKKYVPDLPRFISKEQWRELTNKYYINNDRIGFKDGGKVNFEDAKLPIRAHNREFETPDLMKARDIGLTGDYQGKSLTLGRQQMRRDFDDSSKLKRDMDYIRYSQPMLEGRFNAMAMKDPTSPAYQGMAQYEQPFMGGTAGIGAMAIRTPEEELRLKALQLMYNKQLNNDSSLSGMANFPIDGAPPMVGVQYRSRFADGGAVSVDEMKYALMRKHNA